MPRKYSRRNSRRNSLKRKSLKKKSFKKRSFRRRSLRGGTNNTQPYLETVGSNLSNTSSQYFTPRTGFTPREYSEEVSSIDLPNFNDLSFDELRFIFKNLSDDPSKNTIDRCKNVVSYCSTNKEVRNFCKDNSKVQNVINQCKKYFADRKSAIERVSDNGDLENVDPIFRNDKSVVLAAVNNNGEALFYASPELQADREVVLAAVSNWGYALRLAPEHLQNDRSIVLAAVQNNGEAIIHASPELQNDREVLLAAVSNTGDIIGFPQIPENNKDIVLAAVNNNGLSLRFASPDLRADPDVIRAAITQNPNANRYAITQLQKFVGKVGKMFGY